MSYANTLFNDATPPGGFSHVGQVSVSTGGGGPVGSSNASDGPGDEVTADEEDLPPSSSSRQTADLKAPWLNNWVVKTRLIGLLFGKYGTPSGLINLSVIAQHSRVLSLQDLLGVMIEAEARGLVRREHLSLGKHGVTSGAWYRLLVPLQRPQNAPQHTGAVSTTPSPATTIKKETVATTPTAQIGSIGLKDPLSTLAGVAVEQQAMQTGDEFTDLCCGLQNWTKNELLDVMRSIRDPTNKSSLSTRGNSGALRQRLESFLKQNRDMVSTVQHLYSQLVADKPRRRGAKAEAYATASCAYSRLHKKRCRCDGFGCEPMPPSALKADVRSNASPIVISDLPAASASVPARGRGRLTLTVRGRAPASAAPDSASMTGDVAFPTSANFNLGSLLQGQLLRQFSGNTNTTSETVALTGVVSSSISNSVRLKTITGMRITSVNVHSANVVGQKRKVEQQHCNSVEEKRNVQDSPDRVILKRRKRVLPTCTLFTAIAPASMPMTTPTPMPMPMPMMPMALSQAQDIDDDVASDVSENDMNDVQ